MPKTRAQLALKVLEELGVLGGGQDAPAEDVATVNDMIDPVVAGLAADEVVYIADVNDIPDGYFLPLVICVAGACANAFEKQRAKNAEGEDIEVVAAERRLWRLRGQATSAPLKVDYF